MNSSLFAALILTALVVTFSLQNSQVVQIHFLSWYFEGALVFVLLLTFAIGVLSMFLVALPGRFRRYREISEVRKQLEQCRRETDHLRGMEKFSDSIERTGQKQRDRNPGNM